MATKALAIVALVLAVLLAVGVLPLSGMTVGLITGLLAVAVLA